MDRGIALKISNVSKKFKLPIEQAGNIKQAFINWTKGIKGYKEQQVLSDISFTVKKGDFFGIVGRNGSGKSTLLKLISGIYTPNSGNIIINGSLVPFIELGVGFNPELTGRENVYLNGAMLGFDDKQINAMYDDIVDFAELHDFMDQKLKNYSSGMQVRLAFSVAIKAKGDILVLDEVLAVGDEAFQRKCYNYFAELKRRKKTVILVTHDMDSVQRFCNEAILINKGKIELAGKSSKVAQLYRDLNDTSKISNKTDNRKNTRLKDVDIDLNIDNTDNVYRFTVEILSKIDMRDVVITFIIRRDSGEWVYRFATDDDNSGSITIKKNRRIKIKLSMDNIFANGIYYISVAIKKYDRTEIYASLDDIGKFEVVNKKDSIYWQIPTEIELDGVRK